MLRMSKLTDYGFVLLSHFAREPQSVWTAKDLSKKSKIPLPTVGKLLKNLCRAQILISQRGRQGGYQLAAPPQEVSVVDVLKILEGSPAITDCTSRPSHPCEIEEACPVKTHWHKINSVVTLALKNLTLIDLTTVRT